MPSQINLINPDNSTTPLFLKEPLRSVESGECTQDLLGNDIASLKVVSAETFEVNIGCSVVLYGKTYTMNQMPSVKKLGERYYEYTLNFEGPQYLLRRAAFFNTDITGYNNTGDFPLTADCELYLDVLISNLNRVYGSGVWIKGVFPTTPVKTIQFAESNCLSALQQICKEFEQEFEIIEGSGTYTINIKKVGSTIANTYSFGKGKGLYELQRDTVKDEDIITRLYPFGGTKNLRANYRGYSQRLMIGDPPNGNYIDAPDAIAAFGIIEGQKYFDDIFPSRTGTVTSVISPYVFTDASMDFDLNETDGSGNTKYLIAGVQAKIHFNTGNLAGYEFGLAEKNGYVHSTKTFTLVPFEDERGLKLPSESEVAFQIQPGDEYVIIDIMLPDSYVETAELTLRSQAQLFLDQNKAPKVQYSLTFDEMYLQELAGPGAIVNYFEVGDYVRIVDSELAIDKASRVISMTRDVLHPYRYKLTIDDTYDVNIITQLINSQKETNKIIKVNDLRDPNRARLGWKTTMELLSMIFDTDGYFDGGKIRPESIETLMLVVGAKSMQFILQDVVIQPNFEGQPNVVVVSDGLLIHYALKEEIVTWQIQGNTYTIPDNNARYIYAKVSKTDYNEGQLFFSEDQIMADEDPNYYHFMVGTLHSVMDGVRWISLTYGATAINGRFIKTGRIQSFDGQTYFDLDLGAIGGYIKFIDSQGNYRDLSDIGAATDRFYEVTVIEPLDSYPAGFITGWFQASDPAVWPGGNETYHTGDMWFNSASALLFRREGGAWVPVVDAATVASYTKQYTIRGNNSSTRFFTAQPVAPYSDNDLWMSPLGLRRSVRTKVTGMPFDPNDWVEPFNFDNTATAIDGHIITSGILQLAGDKNAIWAGVSGEGTDDTSVRFWAGASTVNRDTAPFRVFQNGWLFARNRIEVEGVDGTSPTGYKGQAGLAGSEVEDATGVRIYAGSDYDGKETAPFRVTGEGYVIAEKGTFGKWEINGQTGGITNMSGDAYIIARRTAESPSDGKTEAMIGPNIFSATLGGAYKGAASFEASEKGAGHTNIAARFSASGATPGILGEYGDNFAIYSDVGKSLLGEALINGEATLIEYLTPGELLTVDPTMYSLIGINYGSSGNVFVKLKTTDLRNTLRDGKTVTVVSLNDVNNDLFIYETVRGSDAVRVGGGGAFTMKYLAGHWYGIAHHNNDW